MAEEVITKFVADTSDYSAKFQEIENRLKTQEAAISSFGEKGKEAFGKTGKAAEEAGKQTSAFSKGLEDLGKTLIAAFAIERIVAFGTASVKAFQDAEKAAVKLKTAVGVSGGLQKDLDRLIAQSKELEKISIFSDDDIQAAQTIALQFGLTSKQVDELLPKIADFASATGQDLNSALQSVLGGVNGVGKGLKQYGITLAEGGTATENLARISDQLTQKYSDQAKIVGETAFGAQQKLNNELNNQQEIIGKRLVPIYQTLRQVFLDFIGGVVTLIEAGANLFNSDKSILNPANWGKTTKTTAEFNAQFKETVEFIKQANKDTSIQQLRSELSATAKEYKTLTGEAKVNAQATITALSEIIKERESASTTEFKNAKELKKLTDEQLKSERALVDLKTGVAARTAVQLIDREIKAREEQKKLNEKAAAEQEKLDAIVLKGFDVARDEYEKIEKEKNAIQLKSFEVAREEYEKAQKDKSDFDRKGYEAAREDYEKFLKDQEKATKESEEKKQAIIQASFELAKEISGLLFDLGRSQRDAEIEALEERQDERSDEFDKQEEELESLHARRLISDKEFEARSAAIKEQRVASEKKIAAEIAEIKRKQAIADKAQAAFSIILSTAQAIMKTVGVTGFFGLPLAIILGVLGAAQLATVIAQPIPKFAKGTKGASKGLSMVGEEGAELMFVPDQAKILPAGKTRTFGEAIDAMYDNRFDKYVYDKFVTPALLAQKAKYEAQKSESFAQNIANSIMVAESLDEYGMYRAITKGNEKLPKRIGKAVAEALAKSQSTQSHYRA